MANRLDKGTKKMRKTWELANEDEYTSYSRLWRIGTTRQLRLHQTVYYYCGNRTSDACQAELRIDTLNDARRVIYTCGDHSSTCSSETHPDIKDAILSLYKSGVTR